MPAKVEIKSDYALISLTSPELDSSNSQEFKEIIQQISEKGINKMILNMENCNYCNSSGLSAILVANRTCKNNMGNFALCGLQQSIVRLITISQLNTILKITDSISDAEEFMSLN
ncbi:MAG TPA: hypothetical protein DCQ31_09300 [Bacteroidales bacterium]|nr:hypothetical protein [Bacteroidales bacterium]